MDNLDEQITIESRKLETLRSAAHTAKCNLNAAKAAIINGQFGSGDAEMILRHIAASPLVRDAEAAIFKAHAEHLAQEKVVAELEARFVSRRDGELKKLHVPIEAFAANPTIATAKTLYQAALPAGPVVSETPVPPEVWRAMHALIALADLRSLRRAG